MRLITFMRPDEADQTEFTTASVRPRQISYAITLLLTSSCATWWWRAHSTPRELEPEPLWHNGIIVEVRHCDKPVSEHVILRCAAILCAQRVTQRLTNAQQATLKIVSYGRDPSTGKIHISGSLDQYLRAPTLPTGFSCEVENLQRVEPTLLFGKGLKRGS